ncbi:hypothetical protein DFJ73DRAFT_807013 [Zopfochytrium polystomum]|nr:hypothetical protein DFJ73DRAFT_807013 [Zopfochytrium polystomum]
MSAPTPRRATPLPQPSATPSPFTQSTPPPAALPSRYPQPRWRRFSSLLVADGGNSDDESDGDDSDEDDLDALPLRARDEHNDEGGRRSHFQFRHTSSGMDGTSSDSDFTDGANGSGKNSGDDAMSGGFSLSNAGTPGTASSGSGRDAGLSFFGSSPNSSGQAGAHFSRRLRPHQRVRPSLHRASSRNRPSPIQTTTMGANFHFGRLPISPTHQNDAMMVEGSASGLPTPRRASTAGLRGLSRIATILKRAISSRTCSRKRNYFLLKLATPLIEKTRLMPSDSRRSSLDADAFGESAQSFVETLEAIDPDVPLPRSIPLTNFQIKDPSSYISHSSKLNPENNVGFFRNLSAL